MKTAFKKFVSTESGLLSKEGIKISFVSALLAVLLLVAVNAMASKVNDRSGDPSEAAGAVGSSRKPSKAPMGGALGKSNPTLDQADFQKIEGASADSSYRMSKAPTVGTTLRETPGVSPYTESYKTNRSSPSADFEDSPMEGSSTNSESGLHSNRTSQSGVYLASGAGLQDSL